MSRLTGKRAIITGGAQGQGVAIARHFVREGASVVIADVADESGKALADELGDAASFKSPRRELYPESWAVVVEAAETSLGGHVNVLVNNAGILRFGEVDTMPLDDLDLVHQRQHEGLLLRDARGRPGHEAGAPGDRSSTAPRSRGSPGCRR